MVTSSNVKDVRPEIVQAASLITFRRDPAGGAAQILVVERSPNMRFAGGAAVFPGGRVEASDLELAGRLKSNFDPVEAASRIAAIRETLEETGLVVGMGEKIGEVQAADARDLLIEQGHLSAVLDHFSWSLELDKLVPFARWLPKHHKHRGYDTRFYLTDLGAGQVNVEADGTESRHLFWASANNILRYADEGRISVIFPTRRNLERLAQFEHFEDCARHADAIPVRPITPEIELVDGKRWMTIPEDIGYPITCAMLPD